MRKAWNKLTHEDAIKNMQNRLNSEKYTFENFIYTKSSEKSFVTCSIHGNFSISYNNFMRGRNCPRCKSEKLSSLKSKQYGYNTENIVKAFKKKFGNEYDYSLVDYVNKDKKVKIICKHHGIFEKTPNKHLSGQGCPSCVYRVFNYNKPAILYYIKHKSGVYKIGVTNKTNVIERFKKYELDDFTIIKTWNFETGKEAVQNEKFILGFYSDYNVKINELTGSTEWFDRDVLSIKHKHMII